MCIDEHNMFQHVLKTGRFMTDIHGRFGQGGKVQRADAVWLRQRLQHMGPTYIKIGQFMSTRQDIFDRRIVEALRDLQDRAEPLTNSREVITANVDTSQFASIDWQPLAAASIGQVHRAKLRTGEEVVIKVKRPDVGAAIKVDTDIWRASISLMRFTGRANIEESLRLVDDFTEFIMNETDFELEAHHMTEFGRDTPPGVVVPRIYNNMCTSGALVMEYVPSMRLSEAKKTMTAAERSALAHRLMDVIMNQLVSEGMVHGDPHEGNLGVTQDGSIVLYDFGNVLTIDVGLRMLMRQLVFEILIENVDGAIEVMRRMTDIMEVRNEAKLRLYLQKYMQYIKTIDVGVFASLASDKEAYDVLPVRFDGIVFRLIRVFGILEGICKDLDPAFDYHGALSRHLVSREFLEQRARTDIGRILMRVVGLIK